MEKLDLDKYFLNKEHSSIMRELGFNEPCIFYFDEFDQNFGNITHSNDGDYVKVNPKNTMLPRPSYDQAFDWFRESKCIEVSFKYKSGLHSYIIDHAYSWRERSTFNYDSPFECKKACLVEILQLLKYRNENK